MDGSDPPTKTQFDMITKKHMKPEHFAEAIALIQDSESIKVSFNVPVKDNYSYCHDILIHNSNASIVEKLVKSGFSLSMCDKGLSVTKY